MKPWRGQTERKRRRRERRRGGTRPSRKEGESCVRVNLITGARETGLLRSCSVAFSTDHWPPVLNARCPQETFEAAGHRNNVTVTLFSPSPLPFFYLLFNFDQVREVFYVFSFPFFFFAPSPIERVQVIEWLCLLRETTTKYLTLISTDWSSAFFFTAASRTEEEIKIHLYLFPKFLPNYSSFNYGMERWIKIVKTKKRQLNVENIALFLWEKVARIFIFIFLSERESVALFRNWKSRQIG